MIKHIVGAPKNTPLYKADSISDLVQFFKMLAEKEELLMNVTGLTQKARALHQGQRNAYRDAADILSKTWIEYSGLAIALDSNGGPQGSKEREEMLNALSEVLTMKDIDGLQERLP